MKNISLYVPKLDDYWYEEKLLADAETMNYNAGYEVTYDGYDYNTGCIKFPKDKWYDKYQKRKSRNEYFAYIKNNLNNEYVGYVYYHYDKELKHYDCGILIEAKYCGMGYAKAAIKELCNVAKENGISELYDNFEIERKAVLKVFEDVGFKIEHVLTWKKFDKDVSGVIVKITL